MQALSAELHCAILLTTPWLPGRALKRAETNVGAQEHAKNLQHLNRRLAEQGLPSSPGLDGASRPASRSMSRCNSRPSSARSPAGQQQQEDLKPWQPKKEHGLIR
jgi:hypothetical protein